MKSILTLLSIIAILYVIHTGRNHYIQNSEIQPQSYAALLKNIQLYPTDETLKSIIVSALNDGEITGIEYGSITTHIMNVHTIYSAVSVDQSNEGAKESLIFRLKSA